MTVVSGLRNGEHSVLGMSVQLVFDPLLVATLAGLYQSRVGSGRKARPNDLNRW